MFEYYVDSIKISTSTGITEFRAAVSHEWFKVASVNIIKLMPITGELWNIETNEKAERTVKWRG